MWESSFKICKSFLTFQNGMKESFLSKITPKNFAWSTKGIGLLYNVNDGSKCNLCSWQK